MAKAIGNTGGTSIAEPVETKKAVESRYSAFEFAKAADADKNLFGAGVTQDVVAAAFFVAGKQDATKTEAHEIVKKFLEGGRK